MNARVALMPDKAKPRTVAPHEAGTTWLVVAVDGTKLATLYERSALAGGGYGADMALAAEGAAFLVVGAGLPRLPLTRPNDLDSGPLSWKAVAQEVAALLKREGWIVYWPGGAE